MVARVSAMKSAANTAVQQLVYMQGRRKLPRGGAGIRCGIGGHAAADSVSAQMFLIIQLSCQEIAFVASRYIEGHALTSCSSILSLSIPAEIEHAARERDPCMTTASYPVLPWQLYQTTAAETSASQLLNSRWGK